jgi:hypothetical protein
MCTDDLRGRLDDLAESTWAFAALCASADPGLLALLASPRRVAEAAETVGMPAEITARVLDVLVALGFARRRGDIYEAVDGLQPMLTMRRSGSCSPTCARPCTVEDLARIGRGLNDRPRKTLGCMKPSERLAELLALTA